MTSSPLIHVLHVVDRTGGGVPVAAATYIRHSPPGIRHSVLTPFEDGSIPSAWDGAGVDMLDLGFGHIPRMRKIARAVKQIQPQIVHAHSSFAGGYARLALRRGPQRLIYSPHCFAFERRDISAAARSIVRGAEWLLGWNTDELAACSHGERAQSERLRSLRGKSSFIPNLPSISSAQQPADWDGVSPLRVAMIGRVSTQKDAPYFVEAIESLRRHADVRALWFGDGSSRDVDALREAGVEVSGWLDPEQLSRRLSSVHLYLHSAAWEGFPISVLDANALRLPIVVRSIEAFDDVPRSLTLENAKASLFNALSSADSFREWSDDNRRSWDQYFAENTLDVQRERLRLLWGAPDDPHSSVRADPPEV